MKRLSLKTIEIEREETQVNGTENVFNKIIEEYFPNPKKEMPLKVQEGHTYNRTANRMDPSI